MDRPLDAAEQALRDSETRFRELADNMSQFAWTADPAGQRHWYNKRWYDYTGATPEEMQGWGWQKLHHPDHLPRVLERFRRSFESGTPWEDTFPLRGRDGNYRWFLTRAQPIRDAAGQVIRWFGTNTDITEQVEAEKALRALNENLEQRVAAEMRERAQIWNVSQDLIAVTDLEGKYLSVNPAWSAMLGWTEADLVGRDGAWLLHPEERDSVLEEFGRLSAGLKTERFECRFRHRDGSYRWIAWKGVNAEGHIYGIGRDITALKAAEKKLRNARRELAQVARRTTLAAMTASIAHEINQPLAALVTNASVAQRWLAAASPDLGEVRAALRQIIDDGHRASDIIAGLRAMFGKGDKPASPLQVNELVRDALALAHGELEGQRIVLRTELREGLPSVLGERVPLQQVLLNLVTNAIDAMGAITHRTRELWIGTREGEAGGVLITVTDTGPGIAPGDLARIFDAFFTTKAQGMGMGLYICRSIVEAHGGELSVEPGALGGASFHVRLPAAS